eukprot:357395-Chlamydomonas_euryale.AAC.4
MRLREQRCGPGGLGGGAEGRRQRRGRQRDRGFFLHTSVGRLSEQRCGCISDRHGRKHWGQGVGRVLPECPGRPACRCMHTPFCVAAAWTSCLT